MIADTSVWDVNNQVVHRVIPPEEKTIPFGRHGTIFISRVHDHSSERKDTDILVLTLSGIDFANYEALRESCLEVSLARLPDWATYGFLESFRNGTAKIVCKGVPRTDVYVKLRKVK